MKGSPIRPSTTWQDLAKVLLPKVYDGFCSNEAWKDANGSVMSFFFELLAATKRAHRNNDEEFLVCAYAFAHWCMMQPDRDLWNSAGVAFFADMFGDLPADTVAPWIESGVFAEVVPLIEFRLGAERARRIRKRFEARRETLERNYASVIARAHRQIAGAA